MFRIQNLMSYDYATVCSKMIVGLTSTNFSREYLMPYFQLLLCALSFSNVGKYTLVAAHPKDPLKFGLVPQSGQQRNSFSTWAWLSLHLTVDGLEILSCLMIWSKYSNFHRLFVIMSSSSQSILRRASVLD